jgi:hypothetical protein
MSVYMGEFHKFNSAILEHFNTRNKQAARFGIGLPSSEATRLLEMQGETVGGEEVGVQSYLKGLVEDEEVRRKWNMALQRHRAIVQGFVNIKERIRKEGFVGQRSGVLG